MSLRNDPQYMISKLIKWCSHNALHAASLRFTVTFSRTTFLVLAVLSWDVRDVLTIHITQHLFKETTRSSQW